MKKIILVSLFSIFSSQAVMAGMLNLNCEAFRVSKDTNHNIQSLKITQDGVSINDSEFLEVISGDLTEVPGKLVLKATDGKGDYNVDVKLKSVLASLEGNIAIGRDHEIKLTKVEVIASRGNKSHLFVGTCKYEVITSCGGACQEESEDRDVL
jgi:hypothetical protein